MDLALFLLLCGLLFICGLMVDGIRRLLTSLATINARLDNIGDRLSNIGRRLESANDRLDLQSACMGEVRADIRRRAKRRAREASQEAP